MSERLGQSFVVENRPGASGTIAVDAVVRAPPDGYTLLLTAANDAYNESLYPDLRFKYIRDIAPIASAVRVPLVLEVNPSLPVKTVAEFITYAKASPGKVNIGSGGIGTPGHVGGELFKTITGISAIHVPYRGSEPMLTDLLGGQIQAAFDPLSGSIEQIRAGKLRARAVTTTTRSDVLPNIPTLHEFLPDYEASVWYGFGAPRTTPAAIIRKLSSEIDAALADAKMRARIEDLGGTPLVLSTIDFGKLIVEETEKWRKVIRATNIKPE